MPCGSHYCPSPSRSPLPLAWRRSSWISPLEESSACSCVVVAFCLSKDVGGPWAAHFYCRRGATPRWNFAIIGGMPPPLMLSRRFAPLFWCQFFAAFNDNFLKTALVFLILFRSGAGGGEALVTLARAVFIAQYGFRSALGGELADSYDKAKVARWLKFAEIFVAGLAVVGYARQELPV